MDYSASVSSEVIDTKEESHKNFGASFDGRKDQLRQFWEAKALYDQVFRTDGTKKEWWKGEGSAIKQASWHQAVATANQLVKVLWLFMSLLAPNIFQYYLIE